MSASILEASSPTPQNPYLGTLQTWLAQAALERSQWDEVLSSSLRELARRKSLEGLIAYGEYVFGYRAAPHHREMLGIVLDAAARAGTDDASDEVVLEPRGHAKSTWANTIFLAWLIAQFPHLRIGLLSKKDELAHDFSKAIRWTYEQNPRHREIFGDCRSLTKWTDKEWYHHDSPWQGSKDMTMFAAGTGSAIVSKRFDIILADDIIDDENSKTPEARQNVLDWWQKTVRPCLVPGGVVIMLGTRWMAEDLYETLTRDPEQGRASYHVTVRKAINTDAEGNEYALWPQVWPLRALYKERAGMGTAMFNCAYQNDVRGLSAGTVFLRQNFQYYAKLDEISEGPWTVRMGIDLASSERETADFTARVITAEDDQGNFAVMSAYKDRRETGHAQFIADGWQSAQEMSLVLVENNQFQSTLIQEVMREFPRIPIEGKRSDVDKVTRARAVAAKYEGHRIWHHRSLRDGEFEAELLSFPKGHDDCVDALGFSMDLGGDTFVFASVRR